MAVRDPTTAISRALKHAAQLSRADLERVLADIEREEGPSDALLNMAYVAGVYADIRGEGRRYMTSLLKQLLETHETPKPATPEEVTPS